jgi:hypothetical protein
MNSSPPNAGPSNSGPEQDLFQQLVQEIDAWPMQEGIRTTDLTLLNEPLRGVLNATVREGFMTLPHFAEGLNLTLERAEQVVDLLLEHGFLRSSETGESGETEYRVRYARAGRNTGELWQRVTGKLDDRLHRLELKLDDPES